MKDTRAARINVPDPRPSSQHTLLALDRSVLPVCQPESGLEVEESFAKGVLSSRGWLDRNIRGPALVFPQNTPDASKTHRMADISPAHEQIVEEIIRYSPDIVCLQVLGPRVWGLVRGLFA